MKTILIIEDDVSLNKTLYDYFKRTYSVAIAYSLNDAYKALEKSTFDLVITDRILKTDDTLEVIEFVRNNFEQTKIICISQLHTSAQRIVGLASGADDYLSKPLTIKELELKVKNVLKFIRINNKKIVRLGKFEFNIQEGKLNNGTVEIHLTKKENLILEYLLRFRNQVISRETLVHNIWGDESTASIAAVDVHIRRLRIKLDTFSSLIKTVRGYGYSLQI